MCASPLSLLRDGPPPPKVVLLPDAMFFTRAIRVSPDSPDEDERRRQVAAQVEIGLEAAAPFPLAQLYYGYFWTEGSPRALAFAAYRRRFTAEQTAGWEGAELVIPAFAALLHAPVAPATTAILAAPEGLTAVHWDDGTVPSRVAYRPVPPEAADEERATLREGLLREFQSKQILDVTEAVSVAAGSADGHFVANAAGLSSAFNAVEASGLDVRDKDELAMLRRARRRDILFWRIVVGCAAAFGLFVLGELALVGGGMWQNDRAAQIRAQAPTVDRISGLFGIANRISDLQTKRLLPLEMISLVGAAPVKPDEVWLTQAQASKDKLYTLSFRGQTDNAAEIPVYRNSLQQLPQVENVDLQVDTSRQGMSQFRASVSFKPGTVPVATTPTS
jgi:hypothetical protein